MKISTLALAYLISSTMFGKSETFIGNVSLNGKRIFINLNVIEDTVGSYSVKGSPECTLKSVEKAYKATLNEGLHIEQDSESCPILIDLNLPVENSLKLTAGQGNLILKGNLPKLLDISAGSGLVDLKLTPSASSKESVAKLSFGSGNVKVYQEPNIKYKSFNISMGSGEVNYSYPKKEAVVKDERGWFQKLAKLNFSDFLVDISMGSGTLELKPY